MAAVEKSPVETQLRAAPFHSAAAVRLKLPGVPTTVSPVMVASAAEEDAVAFTTEVRSFASPEAGLMVTSITAGVELVALLPHWSKTSKPKSAIAEPVFTVAGPLPDASANSYGSP